MSAFAQSSSKIKGEKDNGVIIDQYIVVFSDEFQTPFTQHRNFRSLKTRQQRAEALRSYRKNVEVKINGFLQQMDISPSAVKNIIAGGLVGFTAKLNRNQLQAVMESPVVRYIEWDRQIRLLTEFRPLRLNRQTTDWFSKI